MMPAGRPKLFKSKKELEDKIDAYFEKCETEDRPYTLSGLAVHLGCDRNTIRNYSNDEEFFSTIKKARSIVEAYAEEKLYRKEQVTGIIFNLKENFGWKETVDNNHNHSGDIGLIERAIVDAKKQTDD